MRRLRVLRRLSQREKHIAVEAPLPPGDLVDPGVLPALRGFERGLGSEDDAVLRADAVGAQLGAFVNDRVVRGENELGRSVASEEIVFLEAALEFRFRVRVFDAVDVEVAGGVHVAVQRDVIFLVLEFVGVLVAAADVEADADAAVLGDGAVEVVGVVEDVGCVVGAEAEEGFVAGAEEAEDLVLALDVHLCGVLPFFVEGVAERGGCCCAGYYEVASGVWAGGHVGGGRRTAACGGRGKEEGGVFAVWPVQSQR